MSLPYGSIIIWAGAIVDIPAGWLLCNGAGGTIDLRNRFVVGAGDTYAVGATGGAVNHTHDFTGDGHAHSLSGFGDLAAGVDFADVTDENNVTGTTDAEDNLPPYYALAYIQKV